jgi:hypothetical protein
MLQSTNTVLRDAGVGVGLSTDDILKIEFPTDASHETNEAKMAECCRQLTEFSSGIPWVL